MISLLLTKKISSKQREKLVKEKINLIEDNFISVQFLDPKIELTTLNDFLIFTSKNSVKSIIKFGNVQTLKKKKCFCVGSETKKILEENGFHVVDQRKNAENLAKEIIQNYSKYTYSFFCGNKRKDTLPTMLKGEKISFNEYVVYETLLTPKKINAHLNAIVFLSPSAVISYFLENQYNNEIFFCIGETTSECLKTYLTKDKHKQIFSPTYPTVDNVLELVKKKLVEK